MESSLYDQSHYISKLHRGRHIDSMHTHLAWYGIKSQVPNRSRILEIGCATGHALFPLAQEYPQAEIVGVDISQSQINSANQIKELLKTDNLSFRCGPVHQVIGKDEKFDYILCHGVLSWVPKAGQEQILSAIQSHLTTEGVACVSFNVSPGSSIRSAIWQMIKEIVKDVPLSEVKKTLSDFKSTVEFDYERPYQVLLYQELSRIISEPDHYLLHEVLSDQQSFYSFSEFEKIVGQYRLKPIIDTRPHRNGMARFNWTDISDEGYQSFLSLQKLGLSVESILDGISGTPFREMMLIKQEESKELLQPQVENLYSNSYSIGQCQVVEDQDEKDVLLIRSASGKIEKISHELLKEVILFLYNDRPNFYTFSELQVKFPSADQILLARALSESIHREIILVSKYPPLVSNTVYAHPRTSSYIQWQAKTRPGMPITNLAYETVQIDSLAEKLLTVIDGQTDRNQICQVVKMWIDSGVGHIKEDGVIIEDQNKIRENLSTLVEDTLITLARSGLLLP